MNTLKVFELFAGIGSQTKALSNIKMKHEVVGISEWDINALLSYGAIHKDKEIKALIERERERERESSQPADTNIFKNKLIADLDKYGLTSNGKTIISTWARHSEQKLLRLWATCKITNNIGNLKEAHKFNIPKHDLLTYSFPCQDLSLQGKRKGLGEETRSGLLWDVQKVLIRLQKENKLPKYLLMENVPAIFNIKNKPGFDKWKNSLESMGYSNIQQMLNAKYFGVPQNRNRAFMVSILKDDWIVRIKKYI